MAVDTQHKQVFAGECKYHEKPVDADVYLSGLYVSIWRVFQERLHEAADGCGGKQ